MATARQSTDQIERQLVEVATAQRIAGEEPTVEDLDAARRVLLGEVTADEAIAERFQQIDEKYGIVRKKRS